MIGRRLRSGAPTPRIKVGESPDQSDVSDGGPSAEGLLSISQASGTNNDEGRVRALSVTKRYGDLTAVDDATLDVRPGEFLSLLGPSGSGKTTLMRIIGGFERPDAGRIELSGRDVTDVEAQGRNLNTVFQSYALFPHMTVEANIEYGLKVRRVARAERRQRVADALEMVQLGHARQQKPRELSGGMQQRVALARALVNRPSVLLLDEPLAALDRKLREDLQVELRQLQRTVGTTFIYITHDQDEALAMSDRLAIMCDGRIEQIGRPLEVYDDPANLWVAGFVGRNNRIAGTVARFANPLEVRTDIGEMRGALVHGALNVDSKVIVTIRPERVEVLRECEDNEPNHVHVLVTEVLNHGHRTTYVGHTPGGLQLAASRSTAGGSSVDITTTEGDRACFRWSAGDMHVFPDNGAEPADSR